MVLGLAMLFATGLGTFEPVAGEVMDVAEHYSDGAAERDADTATPSLDLHEGEHIEAFDHCSHAHGAAVRGASLRLHGLYFVPVPPAPPATARRPDVPPSQLFHPPKA